MFDVLLQQENFGCMVKKRILSFWEKQTPQQLKIGLQINWPDTILHQTVIIQSSLVLFLNN